MTYRIEVTPAAERILRKLPRDVFRRIDTRILALAKNPTPPGVEKLQGEGKFFRIRVGDYRVIYTVEHGRLLIVVVRVGHRRDIYRSK